MNTPKRASILSATRSAHTIHEGIEGLNMQELKLQKKLGGKESISH